jgi:hypothetical protein
MEVQRDFRDLLELLNADPNQGHLPISLLEMDTSIRADKSYEKRI